MSVIGLDPSQKTAIAKANELITIHISPAILVAEKVLILLGTSLIIIGAMGKT